MEATGLDWFGFTSQVVGVVIGGLLVIVANEIAERRRRRSAHEEFEEHERAVYTAVFAIRNFLLHQLEMIEAAGPTLGQLSSLEMAQKNLHLLIEKSRPGGQMLMLVLFEISLRLDDLIAAARRLVDAGQANRVELDAKVEALVQSLEQFDLASDSSLEWVEEEIVEDLLRRKQHTSSESGA